MFLIRFSNSNDCKFGSFIESILFASCDIFLAPAIVASPIKLAIPSGDATLATLAAKAGLKPKFKNFARRV